jgi:hypothetical protein
MFLEKKDSLAKEEEKDNSSSFIPTKESIDSHIEKIKNEIDIKDSKDSLGGIQSLLIIFY